MTIFICVQLYKGETHVKKTTNEGLFSMQEKFSDAFFNGLQKNTQHKFIQKNLFCKNFGTPKELTDKMEKIRKEKEELIDYQKIF